MHTHREGRQREIEKRGEMRRDGGPGEMGKGEREEKRERKGGGGKLFGYPLSQN